MKPTIQLHKSNGPRLPKTDCSFQVASMPSRGGRSHGSRPPSIRAVSQEYFKNEARSFFVSEAAFFSVIVIAAAVPLINAATTLVHLVRSFAVL